ncbi:Alpha/Beta hydrolase protein [Phycomyces nitens]|nr:Alpha/Beta hydrolase protein [Phycomyces nitens]
MGPVKLFHSSNPVTIALKREGRKVSLVDYITQKCPSLVGPNAVYHPTPYLFNGHLQTAYASYYNGSTSKQDVVYEREILPLPDDGQIALDWAPIKPTDMSDKTPILICLHGLTGGSYEAYIKSVLEITRAPFNYRGVVINSRGCAGSNITTPQLYSGAYTEDARNAIKHIQKSLAPGTPMIGIGFSLGSNILVKYLGEEGDKTPLVAGISVANPFDFKSSIEMLHQTFLGRRVYSTAMATNLKNAFKRHMDILLEGGKVDRDQIMSSKTLLQFDEACTRRLGNYTTVNNYYRDASSCRFIEFVRVPLLCINALDDPIALKACIPYDEIKINPNVVLATTENGGHIGWFEHYLYPSRWVVKPLAEFFVAIAEAYDTRESLPNSLSPTQVDKAVDDIQSKC